jgi:hypothetical protein
VGPNAEESGAMKIRSASHLHGETILRHDFPACYSDIMGVLQELVVSLRDAGPFQVGRGKPPKRQERRIGGLRRYAMMPVHQVDMNRAIRNAMRERNWDKEPLAAHIPGGTPVDNLLRGDFVKEGVFVEVEFGNVASMFRDLFKFQIAARSGVGEVAVLIVAVAQMAKLIDQAVATFEQADGLRPYMAIGIQMPIWIAGIEPSSYGPVKSRYDEMFAVATANGLDCHDFATAMGAPMPVEDEAEITE